MYLSHNNNIHNATSPVTVYDLSQIFYKDYNNNLVLKHGNNNSQGISLIELTHDLINIVSILDRHESDLNMFRLSLNHNEQIQAMENKIIYLEEKIEQLIFSMGDN